MSHNSSTDRPVTGGGDPLASLHKMSTTAGLGSQDYVAISGAAVAAALLGLASGVAFLSTVLLVVPAAGVICGILALRQIRNSNGTQAGRAWAVLGIALSVALGSAVIWREVRDARRHAPDTQQIAVVMQQLGTYVKEQRWDEAYDLFTPGFKKERATKAAFIQRWSDVQDPSLYGQVQGLRWNGARMYFGKEGGRPAAVGMAILELAKASPARQEMRFRKEGERWLIHGMPTLFPAEEQ